MKQVNSKIELLYELNNLHHVVVQATNIVDNQIYALQLLHKQGDTAVFNAPIYGKKTNFNIATPCLYLTQKAAGHTQTWQNAGRNNTWFVGTKPKHHGSINWSTQIARVNLVNNQVYQSNTQIARLSYINRAGSGFDNSLVYPGKHLVRVEAAVSPDLNHLMIASIDDSHTGYFTLYDLNEVNHALDQAQRSASDVNIQNLHCIGGFKVANFNSQILSSIQGYGIDDQDNIYISSQPSPRTNWLGIALEGKPRQVVKLAWGETNPDRWISYDLTHNLDINILGYCSEFEGIQVTNDNLYLTVAYHKRNPNLTTLKNRIYQVQKF